MSAQAIDFSKYEQAAPPGGNQIDFSKYEKGANSGNAAQPSVMQVLTQPTDKTDKEYMGYTGPAGVVGATVHGLSDVAQGTKDAIKGVYESSGTLPQDAGEKGVFLLGGPPALLTYRMLRGLGHTASDATHVAAAIHDINQSPDPLGTYANAAEKTAAQGAGQALVAIGTEGAAKAAPAIADAGASAVRATARGVNTALEKAPGAVGGAVGGTTGAALGHSTGVPYGGVIGEEIGRNIGTAAGRSFLKNVRMPGEGFGLPNRVTGGPEVAPQYEAPAEGEAAPEEPAQPLPKPKAKTVKQSTALGPNAQVQTQAQPLGQRTIVTDPQTGRPEFPDVVEAKQQAAAPIETKAPPTETPAPQVAPQGTPAETPGPAADDLLERLKGVASRIQKQEAAEPGSADEDLVQQAQDSLDMVRARKAVGGPQPKTSAESLDEFNQRLSAIADRKAATAAGQAPGGASSGANSLNGIFNRLVKGEAGQAGLPGSVTNADEGIAEIQSRPVIAQKTQQVPARGYLKVVGADENSVLKTSRDQDSVLYHRQQIAENGPPDVELHLDEGGNVIGAQGRHRALAAAQQGSPVNVTVYKHSDPTAP